MRIAEPDLSFDPQPPWAEGRVIGHLDRERRDGNIRLEEMGVGAGAEFQLFRNTRFEPGSAALPAQGLFRRCTFVRAAFCGELALHFEYCRFVDCQFLCNNAEGRVEAQRLHFAWCEIKGAVLARNEGVFSRVRLVESRFDNCLLARIRFDHTVAFEAVRFFNVRGLPSCTGLDQVEVAARGQEQLNRDLAAARLGLLDRLASWERLRSVGRLPLFGTSLTALVAIPILFFWLALYNDQLERLHRLASAEDAPWAALLGALQPVPVPALSFWLLLSTLLLGIAATLFALLCPPRIREFSLERWTDELRQPATRYLPASWSRRRARAIAAPCYVIGGGGTLAILLVKLWNAGAFILRHSTLPW